MATMEMQRIAKSMIHFRGLTESLSIVFDVGYQNKKRPRMLNKFLN